MRPETLGALLGLAALAAGPAEAARSCTDYGISPAPLWQWQQPNNGPYFLKDDWPGSFSNTYLGTGMGLIRLSIGKNQGDQDYSNSWPAFDQLIAELSANGVEVLALIGPDWDMANPNDLSAGLPNTFINQMVNKFVAIANRYGNTIKYYEILNEPNCCSYVDPAVFSKLMAEIYVNAGWIIAHDNLHLVLGGIYGGTENNFNAYLQSVYTDGVWDWMAANKGRRYVWDAFAFHPYVDRASTLTSSDMNADLNNLESERSAHGDSTPLWLTEFGWSTLTNNIDGVWVSEAVQAQNIGTALSTFESRGDVQKMFLFRNDDWQGYGIFHNDWSAKPSVAVIQAHTHGCGPLCARQGLACTSSAQCCGGLSCEPSPGGSRCQVPPGPAPDGGTSAGDGASADGGARSPRARVSGGGCAAGLEPTWTAVLLAAGLWLCRRARARAPG